MNDANNTMVIKREKNDNKIPGKSIGIIGITVLILIFCMTIGAFVAKKNNVNSLDLENVKSNSYLIYSVLPENIKKFIISSKDIVSLTDNSIDYISEKGFLYKSNAHQFAQPTIKVNGSNVLLYDRGGTNFRIERAGSLYNTYSLDGNISVADLGKKNNYAYVLNDNDGYQSHLYVFSARDAKLFEWGSTSEYCNAIKLSNDNKHIAVSLIGVVNGKYQSRVILFNFRKDTPVFSVVLNDTTVIGLDFIGKNKVAAITDSGIYVISSSEEVEKVFSYEASEIRFVAYENSRTKAVALAKNGNDISSELIILNKKYEETNRIAFNEEIYSVESTDNFIAVVCKDDISVFNSEGVKLSEKHIGEKTIEIDLFDRSLYIRTSKGIYKFDTKTTIDMTVTEVPDKEELSSAETEDNSEDNFEFTEKQEQNDNNQESDQQMLFG